MLRRGLNESFPNAIREVYGAKILQMYLYQHIYHAFYDSKSKSEDNSFLVKTVITSLWLPCVVGRGSFTFFLSSMISLIFKNLLLLFALVGFLISESTQTNVFLLWCVNQNSKDIYKNRNISCSIKSYFSRFP